MYKIVNNNITITRGETATYNVKVIDKATGAPFILPKTVEGNGTSEILKFIGVFRVRRSDYIKDESAIKKYLWLCPIGEEVPETVVKCNDIALLDDTRIFTYLEPDWDDNYFDMEYESTPVVHIDPEYQEQQIKRKQCYKRDLGGGLWEYKWFNTDENKWVDYTFTIKFPFLYKDTADLAPKGYKYAIAIYGGNDLEIVDDKMTGTIDYKKPLVDGTFTVEADINE